MEKDNRNAYSEVIEILKLLDDEKRLEALPIEMLEVIKSKANPEYKPQISSEIPLEEQNLQPETLSILSWIAMKYWSDEIDEEKETEEESQNEESIETKENNENDENKNKEEEVSEEGQTASILPVLHKDLKWYERIKVKIIEFFNKIFKKEHK
jgi:hypothetical protein